MLSDGKVAPSPELRFLVADGVGHRLRLVAAGDEVDELGEPRLRSLDSLADLAVIGAGRAERGRQARSDFRRSDARR